MIINVLEYLELTSIEFPNKVGLIDKDNSYTFIEIERISQTIGSAISGIAKFRNKPIAVLMKKSSKSILSFFGITYSGNIYVPIDSNQPSSRIKTIIDVLNPAYIITEDELLSKAKEIAHECKILNYSDLIKQRIDINLPHITRGKFIDTDPLYILFTSGSTGVPKGVTISHKSVIDYTEWVKDTFNITYEDIIGNQAPFHFDNSILDIYGFIKNGALMNIIPESLFSFPVKLIEYLNEHKVSFIFWVPSAIIGVANSSIFNTVIPMFLKKILFCGEVMPNKQLNIWRSFLSDVLYANLYGPTEITDVCSYYIINRKFADDEPLPIGNACRNTELLIINDGKLVTKINEYGELYVRGSSLSLGYYNNREKTENAFVQNPLNDNYYETLYKTGDTVYYNEFNEIMFAGRKDFQIKHKGYRLELGEVETASLSIQSIFNACALYDTAKSEIVLFYEAKAEIDLAYMRTELGGKLPKYAIPSKYIFIKELPKNANGKIDRLYLKNIIESGDKNEK